MSFFGGLEFFIHLLIIVIPAIILGVMQKPIRLYSLVASLYFVCVIFKDNTQQFVYLIFFYLLQLHIIKLYIHLRAKYGKNKIIYGHTVLFSILPLFLYKILGLWDLEFFGFLGISYLTFRVVQVIIETYDGLITEMSWLDISIFLLFFPSISSGPIDRSRRFVDDLHCVYEREKYLDFLAVGLQKILFGIAYKFVFSSIIFTMVEKFSGCNTPLTIIAYAYCYGIYMFFDFAGYSLMAVGTSYIFGIIVPDNFKHPFRSIDIKDFWNRWHISLSHWFRDFVFSRFMMQAIRKKWFKNRLTTASSAFLVNMLIMGLWHGLTNYYILYGIYHGILLAATEIYQKKSKLYSRVKEKAWYKLISWFITLNAVMFGFLIFSGKFNVIYSVIIRKFLL